MSHLTIETIARLVDETPAADEALHLATCDVCRAELAAMRDDVRTLSTLPDMTPAPDAWDILSQRLAAEGLMQSGRVPSFRFAPLLQAAAAVLLFVGGLAVGRGIGAGTTSLTQQQTGEPQVANQDVAQSQRATAVEVGPVMGTAPVTTGAPVSNPPVTLATSGEPARYTTPRTMEEAATVLRQTEDLYLGALTRYAELATQADAGDPVARLAALQSIVMTTQAALSQTPTDPVINGYHLTALAQRDAALRQVAAATSDRWY